jgi:phage tail-like protein
MTDTALPPRTANAAGGLPPEAAASSSYLRFLPALYQLNAGETPNFVGRFLLAFEKILTGLPDEPGDDGGLDGRIGRLHRLFDPDLVPGDFLEWLAGWVALDLRADLSTSERREFLRNAVQLYKRRGTRAGLAQAIGIHTRLAHALPGQPPVSGADAPEVTIEESAPEMRVGNARLGDTTVIGGGPPHFFRVRIWDPRLDAATLRRMRDIVSAVIDMEKPAHTVYTLHVAGPTMQIGVRSTIGKDTLITADKARTPQPGNVHG